MDGELRRQQIMHKLFGFQSDEEAYSIEELHDHPNFVSHEDGDLEVESEEKTIFKGDGDEEEGHIAALDGVHHDDHLRSSRSPDCEKGKNVAALSAAVIHEVFGDSDDDEFVENSSRSHATEKTNICAKKKGKNVVSESQKCSETEQRGIAGGVEVFEIPLRAPPNHQMATMKLSNLIGIDPKTFDPATYDEEDIYVTDSSGSKRCVPPANVIRFREVKNPDGTSSFESNARFVEWSNGSWQLFIGSEAFDVSEHDAKEIQSHLFLHHGKGIYQSQGKISRKMKFMPSSLSSNSHRNLTAMVNSRHSKVNKLRHYVSDVNSHTLIDQSQKGKGHNQKKKQSNKNKAKSSHNHTQLTPKFLEDSDDENNEGNVDGPSTTAADLKVEAAAEKRLMKAKMSLKDAQKSTSSGVGLTMGALRISKGEVGGGEEGQELEHYKEFEKPQVGSKGKSKVKKAVVESDEDTTPNKAAARRHKLIVYDSCEE